ncbi:YhgE/Pip domain-containing protein [Lacticaseibacillus jixianensis]|uniref:YhgE/Pip domain-containing protein n=1 Tax=Lacticaseibacillus jixianensis TaxID=2486012 RepID=A0ABW4B8D7_9LACO|nr:YhgE/Pip domain-containing protein [Lacticaseibacillus jixianensis]
MKNIAHLVALDWKRILKSPFAFLLIAALVVIPSLYCWFNVWALWDPYSNTQDLKVAVYSADQPATFQNKKIAIGEALTDQLHHNKKLGWQFVDSQSQVISGVKSGKYYAGIVVPKRFSKDLLSFVDGKIQKPQLKYYVNEKINAVAPKLTGTAASTLQGTISDEFVDTVAKTLVGVFNQAGIKLDENLPLIRRFASLVTSTDAQLPTIERYLNEVTALKAKVPDLEAKLNTANQMATYLPEVNAMTQKLVSAQQFLPMVASAGQLATQVQGKLPEVQRAGSQLNTVATHFDDLSRAVDNGVTITSQSLTIIDQVAGTLPALTQFGQAAQGAVGTTKNAVLPKIRQALTIVQNATTAGLTLIQTANTSLSLDLSSLNQQLAALDHAKDTATVKAAMANRLTALATRQSQAAATATSLAQTLTKLQASLQALNHDQRTPFADAISRLNALAAVATVVARQADQLAAQVPTLSTAQLQARLAQLVTTADGFAQAASNLQQLNLGGSVQTVLSQFETVLSSTQTTLGTINAHIIPALPSLLSNTKTLLTQANVFLKQVKTQLPALRQELTDANTLLNGHMALIKSGITTVAALYRNEFPALRTKLKTASDFIQSDLPGIETQLTTSLALANAKMPALKDGLNKAAAFKQSDWPTLKDAIQRGSAAIKKGEQTIDLTALIKLLRRDAGKEADFLANPVTIASTSIYPIPTYGSQSAPFYLALCIWVGALLLGAILITEYKLPADFAASVKQQYVARWLTFVGLAMLQGLIAGAGNIILISTFVVNKPLYLLGAMFLSVVFVSIMYALISLFGNIGKGIGIIILVLSISGAGGNFPVVLSGHFFQAINPWLPFTYAVNLLRETVGGIYWPNFWQDVWKLAAFGLTFFLLGLLLKGPIRPWINKMHHITRKSQIIE